MKAVVQRVSEASVAVEGSAHAAIGRGLMVLLGVEEGDSSADEAWTAEKLPNLRIFPDEEGKMNRSLLDIGGEMLLVSNFTLAGDCRKGRRPSFIAAMKPPEARAAFDRVAAALAGAGITVRTGVFGGDMKVALVNDGPVTLILDSRTRGPA